MWHYGIWIHSPLTSVGVVHSTWSSRVMWHTHAPTFNKWQKKKKTKKKVTLHILTRDTMRGRGLTSLMVCINNNGCDIRKRTMTIRSEIWTTNISSLGLQYIKEWGILWKLILWSLGCSSLVTWHLHMVLLCISSKCKKLHVLLYIQCSGLGAPDATGDGLRNAWYPTVLPLPFGYL